MFPRPYWAILQTQTKPHLLQHHAMPLGKLLSVTLGGIRETGHRALAEEEAEHAADVTSANLSSSHSLVNLCRLRLHVSACSHSQVRDSQGRTTRVFNAKFAHCPNHGREPTWWPCSLAASKMPLMSLPVILSRYS